MQKRFLWPMALRCGPWDPGQTRVHLKRWCNCIENVGKAAPDTSGEIPTHSKVYQMIPARGPQTCVGIIIDDADDAAGHGDGGAGDDDADVGDGGGGALMTVMMSRQV